MQNSNCTLGYLSQKGKLMFKQKSVILMFITGYLVIAQNTGNTDILQQASGVTETLKYPQIQGN